MQFSIIVSLPNVSNTGKILNPTEIMIQGNAESQFKYSFYLFKVFDGKYVDITELYETLVGTAPDCDKRFTDAIEAHLEPHFQTT